MKIKSERLLELFCDPVQFFRFITGFEPTEYQKTILGDSARFMTIRAGRQTGKTEVVALKVLWNCLMKTGFQAIIIAPTQRQSSIVFNKIDMYILRNDFLNELCGYHSKTYLQFDNLSEIYNLPGSSGETVRGYSPNLIVIDEAAYVKDEVYTAIEPSLAATKGGMILISSPFGKQGRFYDSHTRREMDYFSRYHVPYSNCPFIDTEFIELEKRNKTEMEFQQEYLAEFVEEADTFFSNSLIRDRIAEFPTENAPVPLWDYYLGVDPAWHGTDEAVYFVSKYQEGELVKAGVFYEYTVKKPLTDCMGRVKDLHKIFNFKRIYFDATGLGAGVSDYLNEQHLPIEPVVFSQQQKQELYNILKRAMEQKKIVIPDEPKLIWQLAEMQYEYSSNGLMKIHHPDKPNAHDDFCDALALSVKFLGGSWGLTLLEDPKGLIF